jgi:hypothetical protein
MGIPEEQQEPGESLGISNLPFLLLMQFVDLSIGRTRIKSYFTHTAVPPTMIVSIKLSNLDVGRSSFGAS